MLNDTASCVSDGREAKLAAEAEDDVHARSVRVDEGEPEAEIVLPCVWKQGEAFGGAADIGGAQPRTSAVHSQLARCAHGIRAAREVRSAIPGVLAPLMHISMHVMQAPGVWRIAAHFHDP